jgi:hypothetical protein
LIDMTLGRQGDRQGDLVVTWREMPRSPGHFFYDRLQAVLLEAGFDTFAETTCKPCYAVTMGAPSIPPGRYFRMHMVGYFEGIDSERGIEWRCAGSLSLRDFLRLETTARAKPLPLLLVAHIAETGVIVVLAIDEPSFGIFVVIVTADLT